MNQLLTDVARTGDPARGEAVFRRNDLNCLKCHAIAGAGGQVGPGLESIGASAQPDYLVDSLLDPGKAVKENYHALVVATSDGKVYTGNQAPPDRFRAGLARRRGPRGRDSDRARSKSKRRPARSCRRA